MRDARSLKQVGLTSLLLFALVVSGNERGGLSPHAARAMELGAAPAFDCPEPPTPIVKVKVRVPAIGAAGQPIEYRICVENCSPAEAHHVIVKNPLPRNARFVRSDPEPSRLVPEIQWNLGTIGGGACRDITLVLQPTTQEDVKNCTRVQFEHGLCVVTLQAGSSPLLPGLPGMPAMPPADQNLLDKAPPDGTGEPPTIKPKISLEDTAKLKLTINGHKRQYVNLASHYFLTVANTGKTPATNVLVTATLPEKTKFIRAGERGKLVEAQVAWLVGDVEAGGQRTVELVLKATAEGDYCVKAATHADLGLKDETDACTQFLGVSALLLEMVDRDDPIPVAGKTSYPVLIRSQGSAAVTNVQLKVLVPDVFEVTLVKGPTNSQRGEKTPQGQWLVFDPLPKLGVDSEVTYEIFVDARKASEVRFRVELHADQLEKGRPVIEEESTTIFDDEGIPKVRPLSRTKETAATK